MKHAEVTTTTVIDSHTESVREEVYTHKLKTVKIHTKLKIKSSQHTILTDYMKCLSVFSDGSTDELEVTIKRLGTGEIKITKTWLVEKQQGSE